jgi:hypothetical protein
MCLGSVYQFTFGQWSKSWWSWKEWEAELWASMANVNRLRDVTDTCMWCQMKLNYTDLGDTTSCMNYKHM